MENWQKSELGFFLQLAGVRLYSVHEGATLYFPLRTLPSFAWVGKIELTEEPPSGRPWDINMTTHWDKDVMRIGGEKCYSILCKDNAFSARLFHQEIGLYEDKENAIAACDAHASKFIPRLIELAKTVQSQELTQARADSKSVDIACG